MKKIFAFAVLAALICSAVSCNKENLEPTNIEKDWAQNIDLSNSYVKQLYEQTGVAILTEFDDTTDVYYQGSDYGVATGFEIKHLESQNKAAAIQWLKENILDCFSTECIKTYFPRRIFLVKQIDAPGSNPAFVGAYIQELKYVNNLWSATGAQHAFPFAQGMVISVNTDELLNPDTKIDYKTQYRVDQMTVICDELFMNNNWLEGIRNDEDIFPEKLTNLYGCYVQEGKNNDVTGTTTGMWKSWFGCDVTDPERGDEIAMKDNTRMTLQGYFQFGFPDNGQSDNQAYGSLAYRWNTGTPATWTSKNYADYDIKKETLTLTYDGYASLSSTYGLRAPRGIYRDARNLICALADLRSNKLEVYGDFLIQRLWTMSEYLRSYGIDFRKFNDAINEMYAMHDASSK